MVLTSVALQLCCSPGDTAHAKLNLRVQPEPPAFHLKSRTPTGYYRSVIIRIGFGAPL